MARSILVVAGVLERGGRFLIGQRLATDRHALKWEFPGGKVEPGESPKEALRRELREELGIEAEIGPEIARYEQQVSGRPPLVLLFHLVERFEGEPQPRTFQQIAWERPEELLRYDFLDGDIDFIRRLARRRLPLIGRGNG